MADTPLQQLGPFTLLDVVGIGGMGKVYRARYQKNGSIVAVKVLAQDFSRDDKVIQRFIRETKILKKLEHVNVIRYFGAGAYQQQPYYAMELIEGGSVEDLLKQQQRLSWKEAVRFAIQIVRALNHAHEQNIVHRDLKPANLLLTPKGVLKLSDFGIARDNNDLALTQAGRTVGSMCYMAPEQINGKHPVGAKTDLYALGCVLYEFLVGKPPYLAKSQFDIMTMHLNDPIPTIRDKNPDVPVALEQFVAHLMQKLPADRPRSSPFVERRLIEILHHSNDLENPQQSPNIVSTASRDQPHGPIGPIAATDIEGPTRVASNVNRVVVAVSEETQSVRIQPASRSFVKASAPSARRSRWLRSKQTWVLTGLAVVGCVAALLFAWNR